MQNIARIIPLSEELQDSRVQKINKYVYAYIYIYIYNQLMRLKNISLFHVVSQKNACFHAVANGLFVLQSKVFQKKVHDIHQVRKP